MTNNEIASIKLTKSTVKHQKISWVSGIVGYLVKVEASEGTGILSDNNIFVMQLGTNGYSPDQGDQLLKVATVFDIYEVPSEDNVVAYNDDLSDSGNVCPFYRTNKAELYFESVEDANRFYRQVKKDVKSLIENLNLQVNQVEEEDHL